MEEEELEDLSTHYFYRWWICSTIEECTATSLHIPSDLQNGIILCKCIYNLTGVDLQPAIENIGNIVVWQNNINLVLNFLCSIHADPQVSVEYIVQGDRKSVFALLDNMILHLDIHTPDRAAYQRTYSLGKKLMLQWISTHIRIDQCFHGSLLDCFSDGIIIFELATKFCGPIQVHEDASQEVSHLIALSLEKLEDKFNIPRRLFNPGDLADKALNEYVLLVYLAVLRRKNNSSMHSEQNLTHEQQQRGLQSIFEKLQRSTSPLKASMSPALLTNSDSLGNDIEDNCVSVERDRVRSGSGSSESVVLSSVACGQSTQRKPGSTDTSGVDVGATLFRTSLGSSTPSLVRRLSKEHEKQPFSELMAFAAEKGYTRLSSSGHTHDPDQAQQFTDTIVGDLAMAEKECRDISTQDTSITDVASLTDAVKNFHLTTPNRDSAKTSLPEVTSRNDAPVLVERLQGTSNLAQLSPTFREPPRRKYLLGEQTYDNQDTGILESELNAKCNLFNEFSSAPFNLEHVSVYGEQEHDDLLIYLDHMYILAVKQKTLREVEAINTLRNINDRIQHEYWKNIPTEVKDEMNSIYNRLLEREVEQFNQVDFLRKSNELGYRTDENDNIQVQTERLRKLGFENSVMKRKVESLEKRQILSRNRLDITETEKGKLQSKLIKAKEKVSSLETEFEQKLQVLQEEKSYIEQENMNLRQMQKRLEDSLLIKQREIDAMNDKVLSQDHSVLEYRRQSDAYVSQMKHRINEIEKKNFILETELEASQTVVKHLENKAASLVASHDETEVINDSTVRKLDQLKAENEFLRRTLSQLRSVETGARHENSLQDESDTCQKRAMLKEINSLESSLNDLRLEKESVERKYLLKSKECHQLKTKLEVIARRVTDSSAIHSNLSNDKDAENEWQEVKQLQNKSPVTVKSAQMGAEPELPGVVIVRSPSKTAPANKSPPTKSYSAEDTRMFVKSMEEKLKESQITLKATRSSTYRI